MSYTGLNPTFSGTVTSGAVLQAGTGIDTTTGDIIATAGNISASVGIVNAGTQLFAGTTVTAGTGITSTTGDIVATTGNLVLSAGYIVSGTTPFIFTTDVSGGINNLFIGDFHNTGNLSTAGVDNTAIGTGTLSSLSNTTLGQYNTMLGVNAGSLITNGVGNIGIGCDALNSLTTGNANIAIGTDSSGDGTLASITSGSNNIVIGQNAGSGYVTGSESGNIILGAVAGTNGESDTIRIGLVGTQAATFMAGIHGVTVAASTAVLIAANGQMGTVLSSERFKENIKDMPSTNVMKLRPVTFNYKSDESKSKQFGLIAEEVDKVMPEIVLYDDNKQPHSVQYHVLPAILLSEIQKLNKRIEALEKK